MPDPAPDLSALARARWRVAITLTIAMTAVYFGFIALIAYDKPLLGTLLAPGLTLGMLLGVVVILASWLLTWIYMHWANRHYDVHVDRLGKENEERGTRSQA
jgi:uncharacterized membrane protein (DUF485 family)